MMDLAQQKPWRRSVGRRQALAAVALGAAAISTGLRAGPVPTTLKRAIKERGELGLLRGVGTVGWEGRAKIFLGERTIELGVSTEVAPFSWARSTSWLAAQGPQSSRTMVITPSAGWSVRNGRTEPLPPRMVVHERAQFAIYGMVLLAPLLVPPAAVRELPAEGGLHVLEASHPATVPTRLYFDRGYRLVAATNAVPSSEDEGLVDQRFTFSTETIGDRVAWPKRLRIDQRGKPYFELALERFRVS